MVLMRNLLPFELFFPIGKFSFLSPCFKDFFSLDFRSVTVVCFGIDYFGVYPIQGLLSFLNLLVYVFCKI